MKGTHSRGDTRFAVVGRAQRVDVPRARLMDDARARGRGQESERLRNAAIDRRRAEAPADDEQRQRSRATGEPGLGSGHAGDRLAHRIADPFDLARMPAAHRIRKAQQNALGGIGEHAIGEPGDRIGIVQHAAALRR